ncbi:MAG: arginine--tRNA ligase [Candidatus Woesearchaeota archaeon]|nr:arginine--tRNA ligase [Candidatus Woesearchaeota archaeon]
MNYKKEIIKLLQKELETKDIVLEVPPANFGDYAFPCFKLQNPNEKAKELSNKIKANFLEKVEARGPYLNFFINKKYLAENTIKQILKEKENYGKGKEKGNIMVEFCHANTHKAFHVGHTRNICLGESLCRIIEKLGYKVIRVNYQGDIGMHVAKTIWGILNLKKLGLKEPKDNKGKWLGIVYAKASAAAVDEKIAQEINEINQKLYAGDKKLLDLWKKTRKWSIDYFEKIIYPDFKVKFNRFYFESQVEKKGIEIVKDLIKKKIAIINEGAAIINLEKYGLGVFLLLKSDGTPLYSTKDFALAELQDKGYKPNKILHVVGSEQNMYFKQLIKTIEIYNPKLAKKEEHLSYGLVILPTGKMASREGKVILYDETLATIIDLVKIEIKKRNNKISGKELDDRAKKIALGAIKYVMLAQDVNKNIIFNEQDITRFEGDTGPYLQYSYARASSILKKSKRKIANIKILNLEDKEIKLLKKLGEFSDVVRNSYNNYSPNVIANYTFKLAQIFNEFYQHCKVIGSDEEQQRLAIVQSFKVVMKNSLNLLGIDVIEEM